jgi:hypothetical protein
MFHNRREADREHRKMEKDDIRKNAKLFTPTGEGISGGGRD